MGDYLLFAAFVAVFAYAISRAIPILYPEPRRPVIHEVPSPSLWDSICSFAQTIWNALPYVIGIGLVAYVILCIVAYIFDIFEKRKDSKNVEKKRSEERLNELELKIMELHSRRFQISEAIAPFREQVSKLSLKIEAIQAQLPQAQTEKEEQKPPRPKPDSAVKGLEVIAQVLDEMERKF